MKVVEDCLIGLPIGLAPAAVLDGQNSARPDLGVCGCGPSIQREPSASQNQWSEAARKGAVFLSNLIVSFAIGLCTRANSL